MIDVYVSARMVLTRVIITTDQGRSLLSDTASLGDLVQHRRFDFVPIPPSIII
jgi:hypothetical protein